jgi:diguanylate cyclase (GGDEF)-like protein
MSGQVELRDPHAAPTAARAGGSLLIIGGSLAVVLMAFGPGFVPGKFEPTLVVASVALLVGSFCIIRSDRVPRWFLPLIGPLGTVLIGLSSTLTHTAIDGSELLYMWTVLFSAYFLRWRFALLNVGVIAVVYPSIVISLLGKLGVTPAVYLVGTSIVTLFIVGNLRRQITRLLATSALEARTDGLTGLANRRSWEEGLVREIARQARRSTPLCLLMIDLDHFKQLNDAYGHAAGDVALCNVASVLRSYTRRSDVLARVGGEEFGLLLPDCQPGDGRARAEEIRATLEEISAHWTTPVTVSIGLAALPAHAGTGEELMAAADAALYEAKRSGRNTVRTFEEASAGKPRAGQSHRAFESDRIG